MSGFRDRLRADLADNFPASVVARAKGIYAASAKETLVAVVKSTGLPKKRVGFLAYVGATLESDQLEEDDQAFERRILAALAWGGIEDRGGAAFMLELAR